MGVEILSKEGCKYCDLTVDLCKNYGLEYIKSIVTKDDLKKRCGSSASTYPQILINNKLIGDFFEFQDYLEEEAEPMLLPTLNRFTVFPIEHENFRPTITLSTPRRRCVFSRIIRMVSVGFRDGVRSSFSKTR